VTPVVARRKNGIVRRMTMNGRRVVVLEEREFERLLQRADEWEPAMPESDEQGLYPARETMAVIQARDIIRGSPQAGVEPGRAGPPRRHSRRNLESHRERQEQAERRDD
jgi:hypothetical protein